MRSLLSILLCCGCFNGVLAQVPVREEPLHRNVLENKYVRLLDVWLQPGDTSWFHVHATPSVFVYFTNTLITTQKDGEDWEDEQAAAGKSWFRSFQPDSLVHRVSNVDSVPLHVNDVELLSVFDTLTYRRTLPLPVLFDNELVRAYNITRNYYTTGIVKDRGPMIAELVSGDLVYFTNTANNQKTLMKAGEFLYIEPGTSFYFGFKGKEKVNMVLFEIK